MNLSKKLKYSVLLPIIAFMAVAIALCACIGIKGADVGTTAEAASHTSHSGYTDLNSYSFDDILPSGKYYLSADMEKSQRIRAYAPYGFFFQYSGNADHRRLRRNR